MHTYTYIYIHIHTYTYIHTDAGISLAVLEEMPCIHSVLIRLQREGHYAASTIKELQEHLSHAEMQIRRLDSALGETGVRESVCVCVIYLHRL